MLGDEEWHDAALAAGVAVLYIHGLNPWGFSWWRRTTHENVDLNRNFRDFAAEAPANEAYDELADVIVPTAWPADAAARETLEAFVATHGEKALQKAISGGQYRHADGVFFGGAAPTWSHETLRQVLRKHGTRCRRLAWIDLHTGLGPSGHGERIIETTSPALSTIVKRAAPLRVDDADPHRRGYPPKVARRAVPSPPEADQVARQAQEACSSSLSCCRGADEVGVGDAPCCGWRTRGGSPCGRPGARPAPAGLRLRLTGSRGQAEVEVRQGRRASRATARLSYDGGDMLETE